MIIYVREYVEPISIDPHAILAHIHGVVHGASMDQCAHLDLVDFGQNVFAKLDQPRPGVP